MHVHRLNLGSVNAYLIESGATTVLVDAGFPNQAQTIISKMHRLGITSLDMIFITHAHFDHYGSAADLRRLTGARVAVHSADAEWMDSGKSPLGSARGRGKIVKIFEPLIVRIFRPDALKPDLFIEDAGCFDAFGLSATVIHTPGHTPGSACLLFDDGDLFAGDLVSSQGNPHVQPYYAHDWSLIPDSLKKVQRLVPERVFPGHGARPMMRDEFQLISAV